jgi:transposase
LGDSDNIAWGHLPAVAGGVRARRRGVGAPPRRSSGGGTSKTRPIDPGRPRKKPCPSVAADKAYSNGPCRQFLRRRGIPHTIRRRLTARPPTCAKAHAEDGHGFDEDRYKKRNTVERAINRLKHARAVATRNDKRGYVFLGTATAATLIIWLRT